MGPQQHELKIELYHPDFAEEWDRFCQTANNGTLFHERKFLSYHPPDRFLDHSLVFGKKKATLALFPAVALERDGARWLISHRGSSYGGLVVGDHLALRDAFRLVDALLDHARNEDFAGIELTLPPVIYNRRPAHYVDFALLQRGFTYKKREVSSVVPLDVPVDQIFTLFNSESGRAVRKGLRMGVEVRQTHDLAAFYEILKRNLRMRHNVQPTHTLEELERLFELYPDVLHFFGAYVGDLLVAGVVMFIANPRVVLAFYISHDDANQQYRGVNCLFHHVCQWGIENSFSFLDFGIFTVDMEPNWGLARFKESFGAQGVFRDTFIYNF